MRLARLVVTTLVLGLYGTAVCEAQLDGEFGFNAGGGTSVGGEFEAAISFGEPMVGISTGDGMQAAFGFLGILPTEQGLDISDPTVDTPSNYILATDSAHDSLDFEVHTTIQSTLPSSEELTLHYRVALEDNNGNPVPGASESRSIEHQVPANNSVPTSEAFSLTPTVWLTDSITYELVIEVRIVGTQTVKTETVGPLRILHADGALIFGEVETTLLEVSGAPSYQGDKKWQLVVADGVVDATGVHFSNTPAAPGPITVENNVGILTVLDGEVCVSEGQEVSWNGWETTLGKISISKNGIVAESFELQLPPGHGIVGADGVLRDLFDGGGASLELDANLEPANGADGSSELTLVCETYPVEFEVESWSVSGSSLVFEKPEVRFSREDEFEQWLSIKGDLPDSNDAFWYYLAGASSDLVLHAGPAAGMDVTFTFFPEAFSSHFPHGWIEHEGGSMRIENSEIVTGESSLGAFTAHTIYGRACRDPLDPHAQPGSEVVLQVAGEDLRFTDEAGLHGAGEVTLAPVPAPGVQVTLRVESGRNGGDQTVHESSSLLGEDARFSMPGGRAASGDGPHVAINSGIVQNGDAFAYHDPYSAGTESDYAGANVDFSPGLEGRSRVGGDVLGWYAMSPHFRAYVRSSGVTGIIGADETELPRTLNIGGFEMEIDDWEFSQLSNEQLESDIQGMLEVNYPSELSLNFDELFFNCCGNFTEMVLSDGSADQDLEYWSQSLIHIRSATFASADDCLMVDPALELVVDATVNGLPGTQPGFLTVLDNGYLTNAEHPIYSPSYFAPEPGLPLAGGFRSLPVRHGFYNREEGLEALVDDVGNRQNDGFQSFAALVKAPFFDPIRAHVSTNGHDPEDLPNSPDQEVRFNGNWSDGYFEHETFDAAHVGFPGDSFSEPIDYWDTDTIAYLPELERKVWFAKFTFPLKYDNLFCEFASVAPKEVDLAIFSVGANVPRVTKETTEITFGTTVDLNFSAVLENAIEMGIEAGLDAIFGAIEDGLGDMDDMLRARICAFLEVELSARIQAQISGKLYDELFLKLADGEITDDEIDAMIATCIGEIPNLDIKGIVVELLDLRLGKVEAAINEIDKLLNFDLDHLGFFASGSAPAIGCLDTDQILAEVQGALAEDLGGISGRLSLFRDRLLELRGFVVDLRNELLNTGPFAQEVQKIVDDAMAQIDMWGDRIKDAIKPYLQEVAAELEQFGDFNEEGFLAQVTVKLQDQLCAEVFLGQIQALIRAKIRMALSHRLKKIVASAFQQMGGFVAQVAASTTLDCTGIGAQIDAVAGYSSSFLQAASVYGRAVINHEELELLRLDNELTLRTEPIPLRVHGFFEWRSVQSNGSKGCDPALVPVEIKEILFGATVSPAYYSEDQLSATVQAQFSFAKPVGSDDLKVIGFMGGLEMIGEGSYMSPLRMDRINAQFAVSGDGSNTYKNFEMYIAAEAQATINPSPIAIAPMSNFKLRGGVMFGAICGDDPIHWAPRARELAPFFGTVVFAEGSFPFYDLSCLLRAKAKAGLEAYAVRTKPEAAHDPLAWGAAVSGEVSGDLLCLLSAKGGLDLFTGGNSSGFHAEGTVHLKAKVGRCPICKKFDKTLSGSFTSDGFDVGN